MREPYSVPNMLTPARIPAATLKTAHRKIGSPRPSGIVDPERSGARHDQCDRVPAATRASRSHAPSARPGSRHARGQAGEALRELRRASSYDSTTRCLAMFRPLTSGRPGGPDLIKKNAEAPTVAAASRNCVSHWLSVSSLELSPISKSGIVSPIEQTARTAAVSA